MNNSDSNNDIEMMSHCILTVWLVEGTRNASALSNVSITSYHIVSTVANCLISEEATLSI